MAAAAPSIADENFGDEHRNAAVRRSTDVHTPRSTRNELIRQRAKLTGGGMRAAEGSARKLTGHSEYVTEVLREEPY